MSQQKQSKRFKAFKEQDRFLWADKRYMGYISGVGAGKTFAGIIRTFLNMQQWNVGEMGAIVAPTRQMVVNVIIPEMRDMGLIGEHGPWKYKSAYSDEPGIHSSNGSRALILSADNTKAIERLRGLNLSWVWMDEEAVIDPRAREIAMQRLRTGDYRNLYITTTPKGKNHTYDFFVGKVETERSTYGEATLYEAEDRLAIVGVPTSANPHTPQDYKDAMEADLPEQLRAQEVQGEFVEIGSGVFKRDMLHFCASDAISPDWNLNYILGVDPATQADATKAREQDSDYWAATLAAVHRRSQTIYVLDTKRQRGMSLKQGVSWLAEIAGQVPSPKLYVESNQAQDWLRQSLADEGLNATPVNSSRNKEERLIDLSIPLEQGTVKFVNHEINGQLGYDPRWQNLIQEMLAFPEGSHDDLLDSLGLTVRNASIGTQSILSANMYGDKDE
jgi:predicted phage terminase large subunit-like protein